MLAVWSETSSVSLETWSVLLIMVVRLRVSVTVVVSEPFWVTVTVRGSWSILGEEGQVLVSRMHMVKRSDPSNQWQGGGGFQTVKNQEDRKADEAYPQHEREYESSHEGLGPLATLITQVLIYEDPVGHRLHFIHLNAPSMTTREVWPLDMPVFVQNME